MNANLEKILAGSNGVEPSFFLLAKTFQTPIHKQRLGRCLGVGVQELSKKLHGERGNAIKLVEKIIDEAMRIDCECGTAHARDIAEHFPTYYLQKIRFLASPETCWHKEANIVLKESTDVVLKLNSLEKDERDITDLYAVNKEASELVNRTVILQERIRARMVLICADSKRKPSGLTHLTAFGS